MNVHCLDFEAQEAVKEFLAEREFDVFWQYLISVAYLLTENF